MVVVVADSPGGHDEQDEDGQDGEQDDPDAPAPLLAGFAAGSPAAAAAGPLLLVQPGQQATGGAVLAPGLRLFLAWIPAAGGGEVPGFLPVIRGHVEVTRVIHVALIPRMTPADIWFGAAAPSAPAGPARGARRFVSLRLVGSRTARVDSRIARVASGVVGVASRARCIAFRTCLVAGQARSRPSRRCGPDGGTGPDHAGTAGPPGAAAQTAVRPTDSQTRQRRERAGRVPGPGQRAWGQRREFPGLQVVVAVSRYALRVTVLRPVRDRPGGLSHPAGPADSDSQDARSQDGGSQDCGAQRSGAMGSGWGWGWGSAQLPG